MVFNLINWTSMPVGTFWKVLFLKSGERYGKTAVFLGGYGWIRDIPHGQLWLY